mmetsp:Transcript_6444/g.16283  ORF Transcript_6444/g.16283 Transcript_6444/m.16283 type:complete len:319 (-) Transcript_6444:981-1937(-)
MVWRVAGEKLKQQCAQAPHVNLVVVLLPANDLGRHPISRAYHAARPLLFLDDKAHVTKFDIAAQREENVVALDVAMDETVLVEVVEAADNPHHDIGYLVGVEVGLRDHLPEGPAVAEVHSVPNLVFVEKRFQQVDDVFVPALVQADDFISGKPRVTPLEPAADLLQCNRLSRARALRRKDISKTTFADFGDVLEMIHGVGFLRLVVHLSGIGGEVTRVDVLVLLLLLGLLGDLLLFVLLLPSSLPILIVFPLLFALSLVVVSLFVQHVKQVAAVVEGGAGNERLDGRPVVARPAAARLQLLRPAELVHAFVQHHTLIQ